MLVAAHDQQEHVSFIQLGDGVDEDVDALQLLQASHPEQHRAVAVDIERAAAFVAVVGAEEVGVDAAGDAHHAGGVGAVVACEQVVFVCAGGDDGVRGGRQIAFAADAFPGLLLGHSRPVLHLTERVEHDQVGCALRPRERLARGDALPVVAVHEVVGLALVGGEARHLRGEGGHEGCQQLLLKRGGRAGGELHESKVGGERRHLGPLTIEAGEDVDMVPAPGELAREFAHVDVHATRVATAERGDGIGVVGNVRDSHGRLDSVAPSRAYVCGMSLAG